MSVGRICIRNVDVAEMYEPVSVAANRMLARNVGSLVVVDKCQRPVGLLTDRDLVIRVLAKCRDPFKTTVEEVMSQIPQTIGEETTIEEALRIMRRGPYRRVPVVDCDGRLVGLLCLDDILELLVEEFDQIGKLLEKESPVSLATV
jgi:CBS domain-containing protein